MEQLQLNFVDDKSKLDFNTLVNLAFVLNDEDFIREIDELSIDKKTVNIIKEIRNNEKEGKYELE